MMICFDFKVQWRVQGEMWLFQMVPVHLEKDYLNRLPPACLLLQHITFISLVFLHSLSDIDWLYQTTLVKSQNHTSFQIHFQLLFHNVFTQDYRWHSYGVD